ncbi:Catenin alpha-1 [Sparganum proliferum]
MPIDSDRQNQRTTLDLTSFGPSPFRDPEQQTATVGDAALSRKIEEFQTERTRFLKECNNSNNTSSEVFTLAKSMCFLLGDMTEYTRGTGVIRTEVELIQTAREISQLGGRLKCLCNGIVDQCPDSTHKRDLLMYLNQIALYSHQLNIMSRVKADVRNLCGELGLDNALSLVVSAKNLMSAVTATVKESYIATKLPGRPQTPDLCWQLPIPDQRPLLEVSTGGSQSPVDSPRHTFNLFQRVNYGP